MVLERIRSDLRFAEIVVREAVAVDDEDAVGLQVFDVGLQRGGVHRHQDVHGVARRVHVTRGKLDLEAADPREGPRRGADFSGVVGEGRQVIAIQRHGIGELVPRDLHPIAGISTKPENRLLNHLALVLIYDRFRGRSHAFDRLPSGKNEVLRSDEPIVDRQLREPMLH